MKNKEFKRILTIFLTLIILLTPLSSIVIAANNNVKNIDAENIDAENIIKNLTKEQRAQLSELEILENTKLKISPDINLDSEEEIKIIVELKEEPIKIQQLKAEKRGKSLNLSEARNIVMDSHTRFKQDLTSFNLFKYSKITNEYSQVFNGVAMTLPANKINQLLNLPEVKAIWSDNEVQISPPIEVEESTITPSMTDSIPYLRINELHNEGITGKDVKIGVLDTGIDYNHPDLKDVYRGGYDFVDNDDDPMETTYDDWRESDWPEYMEGRAYYTDHGTHVAGTIAGQAKNTSEYAVKGVAPDVDLYAYRVLGPYGSGEESWILAGIDKAVADGMDIINLSLGLNVNDPLEPLSTAIDNAMLTGTVSIIAAGNTGPEPYTLGSPGASALGITVGASDVSMNIPVFKCSSGENSYSIKLLARNFTEDLNSLVGESFPIEDVGLGSEIDFEDKDLNGKIALIQRGELTLYDKMLNAKEAGARGAIIWNNEDGDMPFFFGESLDFGLTFTMSKEEGRNLKDSLTEDSHFTFDEIGTVPTEGDKLADFSSRGPSRKNYHIKPDITAPGVNVLSAAPFFINDKENETNYLYGYQRMSGTSMAAPHVTGIAALILQHNPKYEPYDVKTALMNTAIDLSEDYSLFDIGAGRVNPYDAVHSKVKIQVMDKAISSIEDEEIEVSNITGSISFGTHYKNDLQIEDSRNVRITNNSLEEKNFNTRVEYLTSSIPGVADAQKNNLTVTVPSTVTIGVKQELEIDITVLVPGTAETGMYQGYIYFEKEDTNEEYRIPFAIRVSEKGIEYAEMLNKAYYKGLFHPYIGPPWAAMVAKLYSPMETIDIILADGDSGEHIGFLGTIDGSHMPVDSERLLIVFRGYYNPFTGDEDNPISDEEVEAEEGYYKIELIATDEDENTYKASDDLFYDLTPPEVTMFEEPGIYEIEYNEEDPDGITWFHGNVYDSNIDLMRSKGYTDLEQSKNTVVYYEWGFPAGTLPVEANGDFKFGVAPEEVEDGKWIPLRLFPVDYATAANFDDMIDYFFIGKGNEYATIKSNKSDVKEGEEIVLTLGVKNAKDLIGGKFAVDSFYGLGEFVSAKINPEFRQFAEDNNLDINLSIKDEIIDWDKATVIDAILSGEITNGIDRDVQIVDVVYKVGEVWNPVARNRVELPMAKYYTNDGEDKEIPSAFVKIGFNPIEPSITDIEPREDLILTSGEELEVSFKALEGGEAFFKIVLPYNISTESIKGIAMIEEEPGHYKGTWTVPEGLKANELMIDIMFTTKDGVSLLESASGRITIVEKEDPEPSEVEPMENLPSNTVIIGDEAFDIRYLNNNEEAQLKLIEWYSKGEEIYIKLSANLIVNIRGDEVGIDELLDEIMYYDADGVSTIYKK